MTRSAVLTGKLDARDRAKLRGRLDANPQPAADPYDELEDWLEGAGYGEDRAAVAARMDLDEYLQRTGHIEVPAHERLRHLAIHLERHYGFAPEVLDRVYEAGIRLEQPGDHLLWHSRGISMKHAAVCADDDDKRERLAAQARRWLLQALELEDGDPQVLYSLGKWHYEHGSGEEAARWFERTLELDPSHGWALLYRAHCLHDRECWADAAAAYEVVPLETFEGPTRWRIDLILECQAYCRWRAGDREGALADFRRFLERLERDPHRAHMLPLRYAKEACEGPFCEELGDVYRRVAELDTLPR